MKKKGIIIAIIGVVIIAAAVVAIILWPKKSEKDIYTTAVRNSLSFSSIDKIKETVDLEKVLSEKIIKLTLEGSGVTVDEEKGNSTFTNKMIMYAGKGNLYLTSNNLINNKALDFEAVLKDNKLYMFVKNIFEKYYYTDMSETNTTDMEKMDLNINKIVEYLKDSLIDVIENDKVKKENTDITIDGKNYKVDKYAHTFTGEHLYKVVKDFVTKIKNDKELYGQFNSLLKNVNIEGKTLTLDDALDTVVKQAESLKSLGDIFTYTLYLDGDEIISKVITININFGGQSLPISLAINSVKSYKEVYVMMMGQKMYEITIKETSENNYDLAIKMLGQEAATGKLVKTDDSLSVNLVGNETLGVKLKFEANLKKVGESQVEGTISFESGESHANYTIKTEEASDMPTYDVSNSAPIEQMTDKEKEALKAVLGEMFPGASLSFQDGNVISG